MKVLFTSQPNSGHWHPLVPLARALREAGHEVAFTSTARGGPAIEAQGFRCFRAGVDESAEDLRQFNEQQVRCSPEDRAYFPLIYLFAGLRARRCLPDMLEIAREWRPHIVVRETTEFAGFVAAERMGIPHAAFQITAPRTRYLEVVEEPLNNLCKSVGLAPGNPGGMLYRYLYLFPRPMSLWNPAVPVPPTLHVFRYSGFNQSGTEALPGWVADLDRQRPTVYATLGTVFNNSTPIFRAILEGLKDEPVNLILTIGRNQDPEEFGPQPAHVHIEGYVPQSLLLPHCDLVICHGGSSTMMDALSLGLPLVIMPFGADQPENAERCAELGVARVIGPEVSTRRPGPFTEEREVADADDLNGRTPEAIRGATRAVLQNPKYRQAAQRLREEIEELPGPEYPVALLEKLAQAAG